jgi:ribosomal subunit interface protein
MNVEISGQNMHVNEEMKSHVERQMEYALGQFETWISSVKVHLEDVNGPRHGVDKQCRVLVSIKSGRTIKVEDADVEMAIAVNRAADRLGQAVSREVDRRREKKG